MNVNLDYHLEKMLQYVQPMSVLNKTPKRDMAGTVFRLIKKKNSVMGKTDGY